jgi:hypothetical protein
LWTIDTFGLSSSTAMRCVFLLLIGCLFSVAAPAASVTLHPNGNLVVFEGRSSPATSRRSKSSRAKASPTGIYLASPGGNVAVAMRIGALVRRPRLGDEIGRGRNVPMNMRDSVAIAYGIKDPHRNNQCTSACFFIFISGIYRDGHGIGIHRPFMSPTEQERLAPEDAGQADERRARRHRVLRTADGRAGPYVEEMYAMPSDRMRWISDDEIEADFKGFVRRSGSGCARSAAKRRRRCAARRT